MQKQTSWLAHAIIWDIVKRPYYRDKVTKRYIDECTSRGLPLHFARIRIEAKDINEAWDKLSQMYNTPLKSVQFQGEMRLN